jgi:4-aminobutyrate aminotransferase/(S)-3-amino-2-methylpropionate transaminase
VAQKENLAQKALAMGEKVRLALSAWKEKYEIIGDVRGLGAMMAAELVKNRKTKAPAADETKAIVNSCREQGLLALSAGNYSNVIRMLAPLVITDEQLETGLHILENAISKANNSL